MRQRITEIVITKEETKRVQKVGFEECLNYLEGQVSLNEKPIIK